MAVKTTRKKDPVRLMDDVSALAAIPNRGPASDGESKAALHVAKRLGEIGLSPTIEPFRVVPHFPMAWALHGVFFAAACLVTVTSPLAALIAQALLFVSFWGDSTTRFYWVRRLLPAATSRHVIGRLAPKKDKKKTVVIAAHMDAGQMGMIFEPVGAERTTRFFKNVFGTQPMMLTLVILVFALAPLSTAYYAVVGFTSASRWFLIAAIALNIIPVAIFTQLEFAGISPGANDNGSGVAVMLELARRLAARPAENAEVWFVGVGSEETYMMGMSRFMDDRAGVFDKRSTYFLVPESVGNGTPRVLVAEGVMTMHHHDPELVGVLFAAARRRGVPVEPVILRTGGTDATPPSVRGYPASGIICLNENDFCPNYHWRTDLPEHVKPAVMTTVADVFEETVRIIDREFV